MDKCRRLFQSSQAPDFRMGDLLHVQSWQYHSSFMTNTSEVVPIFPGSGASHPAGMQGLNSLSQGCSKCLDSFGGEPATGSSNPEPFQFQKPSLEILETK